MLCSHSPTFFSSHDLQQRLKKLTAETSNRTSAEKAYRTGSSWSAPSENSDSVGLVKSPSLDATPLAGFWRARFV